MDSFEHTYNALPEDVLDAIKPIFEDLSKDALLERCVGGFTQNNNESLNEIIWKIAPKHLSGTSVIVEIAAYVAASVINEGSFALLTKTWKSVVDQVLMTGRNQLTPYEDISRAEQEAKRQTKEGRFRRRQEQEDVLDIMDNSNILYGPGIDDSV